MSKQFTPNPVELLPSNLNPSRARGFNSCSPSIEAIARSFPCTTTYAADPDLNVYRASIDCLLSIAISQQSSSRSSAMAARKRPAAVLDAGHARTTEGSASCGKRSRTSIGSTDEYEKLSRLGEGTFGAVYRMRHRVTGKTVAIKFLSPPDDPKELPDVDELLREARFLETCSSGNPYVVGFEGLTFLWDRRRGAPLPESTVRAFMWKLLSGTKMMHHRRVVHRDIKPDNILVGQGGDLVKICDLGLAISMSELPPYNQAGTASYIAPEMLLGKPDYDGRVDTWSLGCVMAEMLTGKMLFPGADEDDDEDEDKTNDETAQLWSIFRLLGMPDGRTWPGFRSLPFTAEVLPMLPVEHKRNGLRDIFPEEKLSKEGFEVLQGLLTCNPNKRLTATKALKLPWFTPPRPAAAAKVDPSVASPRKKAPRIKFISRAVPEKITFKIPVAIWNAQRV
uniref:Uncharacterized protein n=1 Tax=Avena sativa TaxID=4498 RepID=A0ACD5WYJ1_AVESA